MTTQFRTFTKYDWEAFAGAETEQPWIANMGDAVMIVDGCVVEYVETYQDDDPDCSEATAFCQRKFDNEAQAKDVARALAQVYDNCVGGTVFKTLLYATLGEPTTC